MHNAPQKTERREPSADRLLPSSASLRSRLAAFGGLLALVWVVSLIGFAHTPLIAELALIPRSVAHLGGIVTMPFVHMDWQHLVANTIPLAVFGGLLIGKRVRYFAAAIALIVCLAGVLLWLFGRSGSHIGASGLVFGMLGMLLADAVIARRVTDVLIGLFVVALFGGMIWGVLPQDTGVSWEGHLFGLVAGGVTSVLFNRRRLTN